MVINDSLMTPSGAWLFSPPPGRTFLCWWACWVPKTWHWTLPSGDRLVRWYSSTRTWLPTPPVGVLLCNLKFHNDFYGSALHCPNTTSTHEPFLFANPMTFTGTLTRMGSSIYFVVRATTSKKNEVPAHPCRPWIMQTTVPKPRDHNTRIPVSDWLWVT